MTKALQTLHTLGSVGAIFLALYVPYIVQQQVSLKDATIEHLRQTTAPHLAEQVRQLSQYSDESAARELELRAQIKEMEESKETHTELTNEEVSLAFTELVGEIAKIATDNNGVITGTQAIMLIRAKSRDVTGIEWVPGVPFNLRVGDR
jgi:biopolymer transport protein ExbB/TolQ